MSTQPRVAKTIHASKILTRLAKLEQAHAERKGMRASDKLGRVLRNPKLADKMAAPEIVKCLREAIALQTKIKLVLFSDKTYIDPAIQTLLYQTKLRGIVWDASEKNLVKGNEDD